jgi:hypothetical protein
LWDGQAAQIVQYWGNKKILDNQRSKDILKIDYIPLDVSLKGMGYSLIKHGIVENPGNLDEATLN